MNVVLLSPQLNLTDNTTCQLVNSGLNISFYTIDIKSSTFGTPLGMFIDNLQGWCGILLFDKYTYQASF